ncbi:carotenoid biosynthesis protein [Robiginitalea myxolifaciens]|nr:carotenoid biosynthesis protein [Robiginitalea myxolifaciens]
MPNTKNHSISLVSFGIFLIWLFHLSGLVGILIGYADWFIPKTPLNLLLSGIIFVLAFPILRFKTGLLFLGFALIGMAVEWIGVHSGLLFGSYAYGENLGPKIYGVPALIGLNWALLGFASGAVASRLVQGRILRTVIAAGLMTLLDLAIEPLAPVFDFWEFEGGVAPWTNYLSWFLVACGMQYLYQRWKPENGYLISLHLLSAQAVFFVVLKLTDFL